MGVSSIFRIEQKILLKTTRIEKNELFFETQHSLPTISHQHQV
jgi:hypothetical protein